MKLLLSILIFAAICCVGYFAGRLLFHKPIDIYDAVINSFLGTVILGLVIIVIAFIYRLIK